MKLLHKFRLKIRFKIWAKFKINFYPSYYSSHSQCGEDMITRYLFSKKTNGFYVDIGSYHPVLLSNTYHFYLKGWRGINIDCTPGAMDAFNSIRPEDINLNCCISNIEKQVNFYIFRDKTLNTINQERLKDIESFHRQKPIQVIKKKTSSLGDILQSYLPKDIKQIDLLNIDVEGEDESILMSNDWNKFKPTVIIFEMHVQHDVFLNSPIYKFLTELGYVLKAFSGPSYILKLSEK